MRREREKSKGEEKGRREREERRGEEKVRRCPGRGGGIYSLISDGITDGN
jgi:hypothetical protein